MAATTTQWLQIVVYLGFKIRKLIIKLDKKSFFLKDFVVGT